LYWLVGVLGEEMDGEVRKTVTFRLADGEAEVFSIGSVEM
jgi:hypothetical protein